MAMEIPLPELIGYYDDSTGPVTITVGTNSSQGELHPWPAEFIALFIEPPGGFWYVGVGVGVDGAFDETLEFQSFYDPDWEFLADGTGELTFEFAPAMLTGGAVPITPPTGTITAVSLLIELAVANKVSTWSQLKAHYRD